MFRNFVASLFLLMFLLPTAGFGQSSGVVIDVSLPAQIVSSSGTRNVERGTQVVSGDQIRTGGSGLVQIQFPDDTKIVVGANSTLKIDETLFRRNGTARRFTTTALGGSFRFISGKSPKSVYKLATPLATMGIRGTAFDYTVIAGSSTDLLIFNGIVSFCGAGRRCAEVSGGCQAVTLESGGAFSQPLNTAQKRSLLADRFPLLQEQGVLQIPFRASTDGCDSAVPIGLPAAAAAAPEQNLEGLDNETGNPAEGPSDAGGGGGNPAN
jgi:hypothetical protein